MISVLCPTRGRPESVERMIESAWETADTDIEIILHADRDDPQLDQTAALLVEFPGVRLLVDDRMLLSEYWNRCAAVAHHDVLMQCGDDIVFRTPGWDAVVLAAFERVPDRIALVYGDDGFQHEAMATHGFLHRRWMETVGYFVPPYFASDFNDLWLTEVARALGRLVYLPHVLTEHMHPVAGKGVWDRTHQERLARHAAERVDQIWHTTAHLRARDAGKLRAVMETLT